MTRAVRINWARVAGLLISHSVSVNVRWLLAEWRYAAKHQAEGQEGAAAETQEDCQFKLDSCEGSTAGIAAGLIKDTVDPGGWFDYDDKEVSAVPTNKLISQYEG